jgi:hypothetical protein
MAIFNVYWHRTHTASNTMLWFSKLCRNGRSNTWKDFDRLLNVSWWDFARALNRFTSSESPALVMAIFSSSPSYPVSPMAFFPALILKIRAVGSLTSSSFQPPQKIVMAWVLAGNGPRTDRTLFECRATAISYATPGPLNLWLYHFDSGSVLSL